MLAVELRMAVVKLVVAAVLGMLVPPAQAAANSQEIPCIEFSSAIQVGIVLLAY